MSLTASRLLLTTVPAVLLLGTGLAALSGYLADSPEQRDAWLDAACGGDDSGGGDAGRNPVDDLVTLRHELQLFDVTLAAKPQIVAANQLHRDKTDTVGLVDAVHALRALIGIASGLSARHIG